MIKLHQIKDHFLFYNFIRENKDEIIESFVGQISIDDIPDDFIERFAFINYNAWLESREQEKYEYDSEDIKEIY